MRKTALLAFDRAQAQLRVTQAELQRHAAGLKVEQASADLAAVQAGMAQLTTDLRQLGGIARLLVMRNQGFVDYIVKYMFLASRALELFTLEDRSADMIFDYGYVHPDIEADAYMTLDRGDSGRLLALMQAYIDSCTRLPQQIVQRDLYEQYRASLGTDTQFWVFNDPGVLAEFRATQMFQFAIGIDQILVNRDEAKVSAVHVGLVGAAANSPRITCMLEHTGDAVAKRRDGTMVRLDAPARRAAVLAAKVSGDLSDPIDDELRLAFWGRSPAARWRLYIEPQIMADNAVDLVNLSAIEVALTYQSL